MKKIGAQMNKEKKGSSGYALLFAVLVSAVVLGVGVSILNISRKEILLTAGAQQSQYAFYAADSGYECAVYQDLQNNAFIGTSSNSTFNINCGETFSGSGSSPAQYLTPVTGTESGSGTNSAQYTFLFYMPVSAAGSCAVVTVQKNYTYVQINASTTLTNASTTVFSDGFNVGAQNFTTGGTGSNGNCDAPSATKVERALVASY